MPGERCSASWSTKKPLNRTEWSRTRTRATENSGFRTFPLATSADPASLAGYLQASRGEAAEKPREVPGPGPGPELPSRVLNH